MIYDSPLPDDPIDQGDLIDGCPVFHVADFDVDEFGETALDALEIQGASCRVLVLTQTCDLANQKTTTATVAVVRDAANLVEQGILKANDVKGPIRAGRVYGWYFLPASPEHDISESIVDLRQLHTVRLDMLRQLCARGKRRGRMQPLYREHLAKHLADTYSRIGLPRPYATD